MVAPPHMMYAGSRHYVTLTNSSKSCPLPSLVDMIKEAGNCMSNFLSELLYTKPVRSTLVRYKWWVGDKQNRFILVTY